MLTRHELAKVLGISTRTVDEWRQDRLIPFIKLRKVVMFYWPDVVGHLRENYSVAPECVRTADGFHPQNGVSGGTPSTARGTRALPSKR